MINDMTSNEKDTALAIYGLSDGVAALESAVTEEEIEALQMEDNLFYAKIKSKEQELKSKYGDVLSMADFLLETKYCYSKGKEYLSFFGSLDSTIVAKTLVNDAEYKKVFDDGRERLLEYLTKRYSGYDGCPVENLELETQTEQKEALREAKKLMGVESRSKLDFIPLNIIVELIMEDFPL